jgi:hypothetical protein
MAFLVPIFTAIGSAAGTGTAAGSAASAATAAASASSAAGAVSSFSAAGFLGTLASVAGTAISVMGAMKQGQAQSDVAKANAEQQRINAKSAEEVGLYQEGVFRERSQSILDKQAAAYGAAGISGSEGSPLEIAAITAAKIERDALAIGWNARASATGYQNQAATQDYMANIYSDAGMWGAGTALLSGILDNPYMRRGMRNVNTNPLTI